MCINYINKFIIVLCCLFIIGCQSPASIKNRIDIGNVIDVQLTQGNFGASTKILIKCEKAVVTISGACNKCIPLGSKAQILIFTDGRKWIELITDQYTFTYFIG